MTEVDPAAIAEETDLTSGGPDGYFLEAASWAADRRAADGRSRTIAWIVAGVAIAVALLEAIALAALTPLKREVPYTLLVDRQTGHVEALKPLDQTVIAPDAALTRSFLVQYVVAREGYSLDGLAQDYRKVALFSEGEARTRYVASMQRSSPTSPLATLPRSAVVGVTIRSVSSLSDGTSLVRFTTQRTDSAGASLPPQTWASVIRYRYSPAEMTADDRLVNPLGFQVVRYRRDAETVPTEPVLVPAREQPPTTPAPTVAPPSVERR